MTPQSFPLLSEENKRKVLQPKSFYKDFYSIEQTLQAIDLYHREHACMHNDWCTHSMRSYDVHTRRDEQGNRLQSENVTKISEKFDRRGQISNMVWQKSFAKTDLAFAAGFHEHGSCLFGEKRDYEHPRGWPNRTSLYQHENEQCKDLQTEAFGSIHHFKDLFNDRTASQLRDYSSLPLDEYVHSLSKVVELSLTLIS